MNKYYFYIILAASLWGSIGIIVKSFDALGFTPVQLVTFRTFLGAVFIFTYLLIKDKSKLKINIKDSWMFVGTGLLSFVFFNIFYFISVERTGMSIASVLLYTAPMFVLIMSCLIFKEKFTKIKVFAVLVAFIGCIFVSGVIDSKVIFVDYYGIFAGLLSGFGYSLYSIFGKFALAKYDTITVTLYTFIFGSLGAMPFAKIYQIPSLIDGNSTAISIIVLAVFITIVPFMLYTKGLSKVEPSRASILATIEPVVATTLGFLLFSEPLTFFKISGICLVISGAVIVSLNSKVYIGDMSE